MRWIGKLLCLPFLWAGQLAAAFKQPLAVPLLKIAFVISGDGAVGRTAVVAARTLRGPDEARALAEAWMRSRPRVEIAAIAGLLALDAQDQAAAGGSLAWGRAHGDDRLGMLDLLEFFVTVRGQDRAATADLLRRLEARSDLPSHLSVLVGNHLVWTALEQKDFDQARWRAQRLAAVEDVPEAEMALWALDKRQGLAAQAQSHLARAALRPPVKLAYQIMGNRAIGCEAEARELLLLLREVDAQAADRLGQSLAQEGSA